MNTVSFGYYFLFVCFFILLLSTFPYYLWIYLRKSIQLNVDFCLFACFPYYFYNLIWSSLTLHWTKFCFYICSYCDSYIFHIFMFFYLFLFYGLAIFVTFSFILFITYTDLRITNIIIMFKEDAWKFSTHIKLINGY